MTENCCVIEDENRNITEAEQQWEYPLLFSKGSNNRKLFEVFSKLFDEADQDIENIYNQQHINSATGNDLDKFGKLVNVERKSNENDDKYRARIKATFRASTIGTTFDEFTEFCAEVLTTNIQNLNFNTPYVSEPATVVVGAEESIYADLGFTNSEITNLLQKGSPAGHKVDVVVGGTFQVKSAGQTDDATKGLTSDNIETGGTVKSDPIV
jgi:hypothetical protein